jgi:transcriptional regulator with XRE-family HTH domain
LLKATDVKIETTYGVVKMRWGLKIALVKYDKTIGGLAEAMGVSRSAASRWANTKTMPTMNQKKIEKIAEYIGCTIAELVVLEETDFKSPRQGRRVA